MNDKHYHKLITFFVIVCSIYLKNESIENKKGQDKITELFYKIDLILIQPRWAIKLETFKPRFGVSMPGAFTTKKK